MDILDFHKNFKAMVKKLPEIKTAAIKENEDVIIDTITEKQLMLGIRGDGQKIGAYKNKEYAKAKKQLNPKAKGFVDLRLTGDFQSAFKMQKDGDFQKVISTDFKASKLESKYGSEIYILTDKNHQQIVGEYIMPTVIESIKNELQLS